MSFVNTALSGMNAASKDLEVLGNNIANSTTVGFKGSRAQFADVYSGVAYGAGANAVGSGIKLTRVQQSFATGSLTPTSNTLDLAINGPGFFVLSDKGARIYSRAGQFKLDDQNNIVNGAGQNLQGIKTDGTFGNLSISTANIAPHATTTLKAGLNLNSQVGTASSPPSSSDIPYVTGPWVGGASPETNTYNNTSSSTIYDSLGNSHVLTMYYIKADPSSVDPLVAPTAPGMTNQWYVAFQIDGENAWGSSTDSRTSPAGTGNSGTLYSINFNSDGSLISPNGVLDPSGNPLAPDGTQVPITAFTLSNGAEPLNFTIDFSPSTQFGTPFAVQSLQDDGYTTGSLTGLQIDASGRIIGRYTNGQTPSLGRIQIANFPDPEGLQSLGETSWAETFASGQPLISDGGTGSLGTIASGNLESSNVDLTSQLVALIDAQRNFQANAQTIKTGDTITQTIINIR